MTRLEVSLFGPFEVTLDGALITTFESAKVRALLAYLAAESDRPHRREALATLLWPDWPQQSAMSNLRYSLADLRKNIGDRDAQPPFLLITRESIQLNREANVWVDVAEFEAGIGDRRSATGDLQSSISNLQSTISLYRRVFLEGFSLPDSPAFEQWVLARRERLHRQALQALFALAQAHEQQGDLEKAIPYARRQVELEPWHEPGQQQLMRLLVLSGQRSAALAQYEACRQALADELKVEPSVETKRLVEAIRDEDIQRIKKMGTGVAPIPSPVSPIPPPPAPGEAPFKGLQYFDVGDADLFFGREALTARLVGHIRQMVEVGVGAGLVPGVNPPDHGATDLPLPLARDSGFEGCCFLAVVGASGSGKSSVVRAGVVPALQKGEALADGTFPPEGSPGWHIHVFTPTAHPLESLAVSLTRETGLVSDTAALLDSMAQDSRSVHLHALRLLAPVSPGLTGKCRLLLVVDQFEELFTLCRSETERIAFLDNLLTAVQGGGPTQVVVVLRADFYGHCAQYPRLRQALCTRQEYIGPMDASELQRAIEEPARRNGWEFEPGLVDLILRDIGATEGHPPEPGALPLLEHALLETWQRCSGRTLTLQGYADAGGVHGAIAKTAESVFSRLSPDQQALARRIFLRLTELGEGTQDTRRRAPLSELAPTGEDTLQVNSLLKELADARLITLSEDMAEVAHEALIREWPALRQWLSEDRDGLRLHRRLTEASEAWTQVERDPGELYRGARLAQAAEWAESHPDELNVLEHEFLQASQAQAERETTEREAQRQKELEAARQVAVSANRLARTRHQRSLVLSVGLIIAIALGVLSYSFYRQSNTNLVAARAANTRVEAVAATAQANAYIASGRQALAEAQLIPLDSALRATQKGLLLVEGLTRVPGPIIVDKEWAMVNSLRDPVSHMDHPGSVFSIAFSPDGSRVVSGSADYTARVWEAATGDQIAVMRLGNTVNSVVFSPDGLWVATGSSDGTARVWNVATGIEISRVAHGGPVRAVAFSSDGSRVVSGSEDGILRVWQAGTGDLVAQMAHTGAVLAVAFSPDGSRVVSGSQDGTARVWDVATQGEVAHTMYNGAVNAVAFSPDGLRVVSGSDDGTARVWVAASGAIISQITHEGPVWAVAFSPDGLRVVSGSDDGTARVWVADTRSEISRMKHNGSVNTVAFSPDGRWVVSGSTDGTARVWEAVNGIEVAVLMNNGKVYTVAFSPDGKWVASAGAVGIVRVWERPAGSEITHMIHEKGVSAVAFSLDGSHVVSGSADGTARVWNPATGEEIARTTHAGAVNAVAFSPDGSRVVSGSADGTVRVWDASTGVPVAQMAHTGAVLAVAFSPDGRWVVSGSQDGTARVWDVATQVEVARMTHDSGVDAVAFRPDGLRVVSGSYDGTARVWMSANGSEVARKFHQGSVFAVAFSPDGTRVVSGGNDYNVDNSIFQGTARLWMASTGMMLPL